mmetsp:Transcript_7626/g.11092  ORF Transcript_7626/g.11092 Transcript_7626/m.11092 type:complete len:107 (+) Transcript_7626:128-448(+)
MSNLFPISVAVLLLLLMFDTARAFVTTTSQYSRVSLAANPDQKKNEIPADNLKQKAYPQQTPHSGRHFRPSHQAYQSTSWLARILPKQKKKTVSRGMVLSCNTDRT